MEPGFFEKVYLVVRQIPYGRVTTYGSIAQYLGSKGSARMVGWAMNSSKNSLMDIPAHRVVNRNGILSGKNHFGGNEVMAELLINEGIKVVKDKVLDFESYYWDPNTEIVRKSYK